MKKLGAIEVRNTRSGDFPAIIDLCRAVYPKSLPWKVEQLASHLRQFPEGQFVAIHGPDARVVGMAASLVVLWDDYEMSSSWRDFTDHGMFTNHDPVRGRTLYAAEVMVDPSVQGMGVGTLIYEARRDLAMRLGLLRIRAGARLRGYHRYAGTMTAEEYAKKVSKGEVFDPTVSFQIKRGFRVLVVVPDYLHNDPESLGHAAVIEWLNPEVAGPREIADRDSRFGPTPGEPS